MFCCLKKKKNANKKKHKSKKDIELGMNDNIFQFNESFLKNSDFYNIENNFIDHVYEEL